MNICFICNESNKLINYNKYTCNGHPDLICESCSKKCNICPFCRASIKESNINNNILLNNEIDKLIYHQESIKSYITL
jgi:hypothetical protein